jgi:hypothetical protein
VILDVSRVLKSGEQTIFYVSVPVHLNAMNYINVCKMMTEWLEINDCFVTAGVETHENCSMVRSLCFCHFFAVFLLLTLEYNIIIYQ